MSALRVFGCLFALAWGFVLPAAAKQLPTGVKVITLISPDGVRQRLGEATFVPDGDGAKFSVKFDAPELQEQFLSMRPFQCLSGQVLQWCHLSYDYGMRQRVTADDLIDLEYSLMFIWRTYDRVSADAWNGLYFKMAIEDDGTVSGVLHEVDLNVLATPPSDAFARPVRHSDLTPSERGRQPFARIEIK